ncbi:hypothetical protein F4212_10940 [Candidatus Poribacteria bacterium]|nr:hypothetical protein [Candidatus Poribacteria bacterium]
MSDNNVSRFSGEWETKQLGELASIRNQKVMPENVDPNTSCVELEHIASGIGHLLENSTAEYSTASKYRFFAGDVLFGRLRSYLRKYWLADHNGICTTEIWPLMVDAKQIDSGFLHAIVQTDEFFAMANLSYGTHMPRADWTVMRNFSIMLPPIQEQRAIAEVLSDVDGLINALDALIAKKRAIKQATMQQLLTGKTRLPGFSGAWETKRLGEIGEISGAGVNKKINANEESVRLVNYLDVYNKTFLYSKDLMHQVSARSDQVRRCAVEKGDIFFTPSSEVPDDIGCSAVAMEDVPDGVYSYHVVRLRLKVDWDLYFRAYAFDTNEFLNQASRQCDGSGTRYVISLPKFRAMTVRFPSTIEEQRAIATVLSDMDAEITALEQRKDKTIAIKQGMMQQLLTGKVRLVK